MAAKVILGRLPDIAGQLLQAEGPNGVPLKDAELCAIAKNFKALADGFISHPEAVLAAFNDDDLGVALVRVLAVVLRWSPDFDKGGSCIRRRVLTAVLFCTQYFFLFIRSYTPMAHCASALFRSQALQCASQHLAAASEVLRGALVRPDAALPAAAAHCAGGLVVSQRIRTATDIVFMIATTMLPAISVPAARCDTTTGCWKWFVRVLAAALRDSGFLEHVAVGLALAAQLKNPEDPAGQPGSDIVAHYVSGEKHGMQEDPFLREALSRFCTAVQSLFFLRSRVAMSRFAAAAATADTLSEVLAGPCLQHLVAAVGICELHLIDGGPTFGLSPNPLNYRLNTSLPTPDDVPAALADRSSWGIAQHVPMSTLLHILPGYSLSSCPLPGWRVACKLALRVARSALGCAHVYLAIDELAAGSSSAGSSTAALGAGCRSGTLGPGRSEDGAQFVGVLQPAAQGPQRLLPRCKVIMACDEALRVAFTIQYQAAGAPGEAALAADRWQLTIAAMDCFLRWPVADPSVKRGLAGLLDAPLWSVASDCDGVPSVPPRPRPDIAAALEAGLLPFLERMLRRSAREPNSLEAQVLLQVLCDDRPFWYGRLIMYGDATQAASFTASFAKALQHADKGNLAFRDLANNLKRYEAALLITGAAWLSDIVISCKSDDTADGGNAAMGRQLGHLLSVAVHDCLQSTVAALPGLCAESVRIRLAYAVRCVFVVLQGLPDTLEPDSCTSDVADGSGWTHGSEAGGSAAGSTPPPEAPVGPRLSGGGRAPPDGPAAPLSASDWRLQVLRSAEAIAILGRALRMFWQAETRVVHDISWMLYSLPDAMCRAALFMPEEVQAATREGASIVSRLRSRSARARRQRLQSSSSGGVGGAGRGPAWQAGAYRQARDAAAEGEVTPPSYWPPELVRGLAAQLRVAAENNQESDYSHLATLLDALAQQLELWAGGGQEDPRVGPLGALQQFSSPAFRGVARLLVSPAEVRGLLGRCCANPGCINLEGDSEAGLRLQTCGRCGVVAYCGRDCQRAHWAAGHKAECGGRGDGKPVD